MEPLDFKALIEAEPPKCSVNLRDLLLSPFCWACRLSQRTTHSLPGLAWPIAGSMSACISEWLVWVFLDELCATFLNDYDNAPLRLPVIAAVNGFAFGGGCEIAMM